MMLTHILLKSNQLVSRRSGLLERGYVTSHVIKDDSDQVK